LNSANQILPERPAAAIAPLHFVSSVSSGSSAPRKRDYAAIWLFFAPKRRLSFNNEKSGRNRTGKRQEIHISI